MESLSKHHKKETMNEKMDKFDSMGEKKHECKEKTLQIRLKDNGKLSVGH